jgi:hypothetical protein
MFRAILPILLALLVAPSAFAAAPAPEVPGTIVPPEGNKPYLTVHAVGVQIYDCNTTWTFAGPRADLYDQRGRLFGTHFAGPKWQAQDGSTVVGSRVDGINVDPTAIDWLLLSATPTADGRLDKTTFIQRINTTGGRAPAAAECNAATAGTRVEVPYTADYVFWKSDDED